MTANEAASVTGVGRSKFLTIPETRPSWRSPMTSEPSFREYAKCCPSATAWFARNWPPPFPTSAPEHPKIQSLRTVEIGIGSSSPSATALPRRRWLRDATALPPCDLSARANLVTRNIDSTMLCPSSQGTGTELERTTDKTRIDCGRGPRTGIVPKPKVGPPVRHEPFSLPDRAEVVPGGGLVVMTLN